jgi:hypothetical protein
MPNQASQPASDPNMEKKGGYPSPAKPIGSLPKVPEGPAPGAKRPSVEPAGR